MKDFSSITPSPEQESCINYKSGDLLVNGVPGAGKSIVLLKRALEFYKASQPGDKQVVLLTTFNNTLNLYTKEIFQQADIDFDRMSISTLDKKCRDIYCELFGTCWLVKNDSERARYVSTALQNHYSKNRKKHRFYEVDNQFWRDEFLWIKQKNITTLQEYQDAERTGRGGSVRITRDERQIVFELFQEYLQELKKYRRMDFEDIYIQLINAGERLTPYKYNYVLIDEAQDLSFVKLKVAKLLAKESITIAADKAQKIYNTGFTWKEIGIDVRGNASKTLHKTFRSTRQIVQLAESLSEVNRAREGEKGEYTDPILPTILGEDYPYIIKCQSEADENKFLASLISRFLREAVTIGLLYRNYSEKKKIETMLDVNGIVYEEITRDPNWSLRTPGVKLVTLHSSKGLEFDKVIIPYFNSVFYPIQTELEKADNEQIEEIKAKERNLLYVGMTRAKSALYLTYSGAESSFFAEFNPDFYNYVSSSGEKLEKPQRTFNLTENTKAVIQQNDTIIAHYEGESTPRVFCGKGIKNWMFIGKAVGDRVQGKSNIFIVDEIKGKSSALEPSQKELWESKRKFISTKYRSFIDTMISYGIPAPTTVGSELMGPDGNVIAEAELAWEQEKVVFLNQDQLKCKHVWEEKGWTCFDEKTPASSVHSIFAS